MRRPRPTPKKVAPATERMTSVQLAALASRARYIGSSYHKDVPALGVVPRPRRGALPLEAAEEQRIDNPDCTLCPRKWAGQTNDAATALLREGVRLGQVSADAAPDFLPSKIWIRDPEDVGIVYEAKRLSHPGDGYKAYPLTTRQARNLPLAIR